MLTLATLTKAFAGRQVLADVSFALPAGQCLAVLGASGSGKSTLLMLIAGLMAPDAGDVRWEGQSLLTTPPHLRNFGLMFQDYALFPHRNVAANVAFGLQMQHQPYAIAAARVQELLALVGLPGFEKRDVNTLSGGEQQRVALARALAPRPRLLMLDEPLGALDHALRERLLNDLRELLQQLKQTAIYVTHDPTEAFALADQLLVLHQGRVAQQGPPITVYQHPASRTVAERLGFANFVPAELHQQDSQLFAKTALGTWPITAPAQAPASGYLLVRPQAAQLAPHAPGALPAQVQTVRFNGAQLRAQLHFPPGLSLAFDFPATAALQTGQTLFIQFDPAALSWLPR